MTPTEVDRLVRAWLEAWNVHDVEAVLAGVAEDVVFTSPTAAVVVPASGGVVRGREALRAYWTAGLALVPDLRFEVVAVFAGVDSVVIQHRTQRGRLVCEVLRLRDGLVVEGHAAHLLEDGSAAG